MAQSEPGGRFDDLSQEEIDAISSELTETPITDMATWSAVKKIPDSASGAGERPDDAVRGCQKCGEEIAEDDDLAGRFRHFYHERCLP